MTQYVEVTSSIPQNIDAERALLGCFLLDSDSMFAVSVKPEDFYLEKHSCIYEAMLALSDEQRPIDILTLNAKLQQREKLGEIGGDSYIVGLVNAAPSVLNCVAYAEEIKRARIRRQLLLVATEIAATATDKRIENPEELIAQAHRSLLKVEHPQLTTEGMSIYNAIGEFIPEVMDYLDGNREVWGVPTGLIDLDYFIGGLAMGEMTLIAADPRMGKTFLASTMWLNAGIAGYPGALFSLEMRRRQLMLRLFAERGDLNTFDIRRGNVTQEQKETMFDEIHKIEGLPLWIYDAPMDTVAVMRAIMRLQHRCDLKFAAVDYSGLLRDPSPRGEVERQLTISHNLKNIAKQTGIALLVVHPITRGPNRESEPPEISDLGWGRVWEYDAHTVLFPFFNRKRDNYSAVIKVGKYRDGVADKKLEMMFDGKRWRSAVR